MANIKERAENYKDLKKIDRDYKFRIKKFLMENLVFFTNSDCGDMFEYWEEYHARNEKLYELISDWKSLTNGVIEVMLTVIEERVDNVIMQHLDSATATLYDGTKLEIETIDLPAWGFADENENLNFWRRYFQLLYFVKQSCIQVNYVKNNFDTDELA